MSPLPEREGGSSSDANSSGRKFRASLAKLCVSAGLMWILLSQVTWGELASRTDDIKLAPAFVAAILLAVQIALNAARWRIVCVALSVAAPGPLLSVKWMVVGQTFSQVLPTSFGGDAYRIYAFAKVAGISEATRSILVDRIFGLVFLALISCFASGIALFCSTSPQVFVVYLGLSALVPAAIACGSLLGSDSPRMPFRMIRVLATDLFKLLRSRRLAAISVVTVLHNLSSVMMFVALFYALGIQDALWWQVALCVPGALLGTSIPLSFGGWGLREAGLAYGLSGFGVSVASALTLSVTYGLLLIALAVPGVFLLVESRR